MGANFVAIKGWCARGVNYTWEVGFPFSHSLLPSCLGSLTGQASAVHNLYSFVMPLLVGMYLPTPEVFIQVGGGYVLT